MMNESKPNHKENNLLGNDVGYSQILEYCFLLIFEKESFISKHKSSSKWYRVLSNSNQTTGYKSNRLFWSETFVGGKYNTIECENEIILHFTLELNESVKPPNELGMRLRIGKTSKGVKYNLILNNTSEIEESLFKYQNCNSTLRNIGKWYNNTTNQNIL
jgi:hypothetical protein